MDGHCLKDMGVHSPIPAHSCHNYTSLTRIPCKLIFTANPCVEHGTIWAKSYVIGALLMKLLLKPIFVVCNICVICECVYGPPNTGIPCEPKNRAHNKIIMVVSLLLSS